MGSNGPKRPLRPQRRLKKPSLMSFRKLPPLPVIEDTFKPEIAIASSSCLCLNASNCVPEEGPVMHRKWVKLRTEFLLENISASGVLFRYFCDQTVENKGCEVQEISTWIEGTIKTFLSQKY